MQDDREKKISLHTNTQKKTKKKKKKKWELYVA